MRVTPAAARARDDVGGIVVERVEVRVRVDHVEPSGPSRRELFRRRLRRELAEERPRLAQRLAGRQLARRPRADPALVVAGQHLVRRAVLLGGGAELERPGDPAVVAEQLVHASAT